MLERLRTNLLARQTTSVYAARALPGLLLKLDDGEQLFSLAFDDRIPFSIQSTIGIRNIRYARLKAATLHSARNNDYNKLVRLLLELSTLAAVDQRGTDYLLDYPDLAVAAQDVDSIRRMFESRTIWPGTRHARLTIAYTLSGDLDEANRHANACNEWVEHCRRIDSSRDVHESPDQIDIAALPLFFLSQGNCREAASYLNGFQEWYAYGVCKLITELSGLLQSAPFMVVSHFDEFTDALSSIGNIGSLSAALSSPYLSRSQQEALIRRLASKCKRASNLMANSPPNLHRSNQIHDGLNRSAGLALSLGMASEAKIICSRVPSKIPSLWSFRNLSYNDDVFSFVFHVALQASANQAQIHERELLPQELKSICSALDTRLSGSAFSNAAVAKVVQYLQTMRKEQATGQGLSYESRGQAESFLIHQLAPLLSLARALSAVLGARPHSVDTSFIHLIEAWERSLQGADPNRHGEAEYFFRFLGFEIALMSLTIRSELTTSAVSRFLKIVKDCAFGPQHLVRIVSILAKREPLHSLAGEQAIQASTLLEGEDDVSYRSSIYGALGRAMIPADKDESSRYFREGLDQMDVIGSGDFEFVNELLLFASQLKGPELKASSFHALMNICDINLGEEPEKFSWGPFGLGVAKAAGLRGLARLSRWDDRSKITLGHSLLPYLIGLLECGKISAKDSLALNRLANPVEYYFSSAKEFAESLQGKPDCDVAAIEELINQFLDDNSDGPMGDAVDKLVSICQSSQELSPDLIQYLTLMNERYSKVRDVMNMGNRQVSKADKGLRKDMETRNRRNQKHLRRVAADTDPTNAASLTRAIEALNESKAVSGLRDEFFADLRNRVPYRKRSEYIQNVGSLENLFFSWKLVELRETREAWKGSSAAIAAVYRNLVYPLITAHAFDLVFGGRLSKSNLQDLSTLSGVAVQDLIVELIKVFARSDNVAGPVWLACATGICPEAEAGESQIALERLLSSDASTLANSVVEGPWNQDQYPEADFPEVAAGLIWRVLGSPYAAERWRGAHSLRTFAKFGRWEVVDKIVEKLPSTSAGPFQDKDLLFFHLHARLWLLITLARLAHDYPSQVARYSESLMPLVLEKERPHVLMRHFAARTLDICIRECELALSEDQVKAIGEVDRSPHQRMAKESGYRENFYADRPNSVPVPLFEFHLNYDFHKYDVDHLARVFGQPCWKVADMISEIVYRITPNVDSMYTSGGRECRYRHSSPEISTKHHTYGQHLGWHALFLSAGKLLSEYPVIEDSSCASDPWDEWFKQYRLTRDDGLWLSDGTERRPIDTIVSLLEEGKHGPKVTGDWEMLIGLCCLSGSDITEVVVSGHWFSSDNVKVHISSALVSPDLAPKLIRKLIQEDPMSVWVPCFEGSEEEEEWVMGDKKEYTPWVLSLSGQGRLDGHDPFGVAAANFRPQLARTFTTRSSLSRDDEFGRIWKDDCGQVALRSQAWGKADKDGNDGSQSGTRLFCSSSNLRRILAKYAKELLILIKLEHYESGYDSRKSSWKHTVAVVRLNQALEVEYSPGRINHLSQSLY